MHSYHNVAKLRQFRGVISTTQARIHKGNGFTVAEWIAPATAHAGVQSVGPASA
jgi:hypothetical protein